MGRVDGRGGWGKQFVTGLFTEYHHCNPIITITIVVVGAAAIMVMITLIIIIVILLI